MYEKVIMGRYGRRMNLAMTQRKVSAEELGILRVREDKD